MNTSLFSLALGACVLALSACDRKPAAAPTPKVSAADSTPVDASNGPAKDPSLPSAAAVYPPGDAARSDPAQGPTDGTRKPSQVSRGVPMPGQNNDHSAPLGPAKGASGS